jgi:hypothetical protein
VKKKWLVQKFDIIFTVPLAFINKPKLRTHGGEWPRVEPPEEHHGEKHERGDDRQPHPGRGLGLLADHQQRLGLGRAAALGGGFAPGSWGRAQCQRQGSIRQAHWNKNVLEKKSGTDTSQTKK